MNKTATAHVTELHDWRRVGCTRRHSPAIDVFDVIEALTNLTSNKVYFSKMHYCWEGCSGIQQSLNVTEKKFPRWPKELTGWVWRVRGERGVWRPRASERQRESERFHFILTAVIE